MRTINKFIAVASLAITSAFANAAIIEFNGTQVEALDLNGVATSFEDFYGYTSDTATTGLEVANTMIMFVATIKDLAGNDTFGIFTIANKLSEGQSGRFRSRISADDGFLSFVDEAVEQTSATSLNFKYGAGRGDGYIFTVNNDTFNYTQSIASPNGRTAAVGVDALRFITFDGGTLAGARGLGDLAAFGSFTVSSVTEAVAESINAPSTIALFFLTVLSILAFKRTK